MKPEPFIQTLQVRWADVDASGHMRHSAYNDYAAHSRVALFGDRGFPMHKLLKLGIGPVLFHEETEFRRELSLMENFTIDCELVAMRRNGKLWAIQHHIKKHSGKTSAVIKVRGGWIDLQQRKIVAPPEELLKAAETFPRTEDFDWLSESK